MWLVGMMRHCMAQQNLYKSYLRLGLERFSPFPCHIAISLSPPCLPLILSLLSMPKRLWASVWCDPGKRKATRKEQDSTAARDIKSSKVVLKTFKIRSRSDLWKKDWEGGDIQILSEWISVEARQLRGYIQNLMQSARSSLGNKITQEQDIN